MSKFVIMATLSLLQLLILTIVMSTAGMYQSNGIYANAAAATYRNYLQEQVTSTPIYYPKTDDDEERTTYYGCEENDDDPDGDCITGRGGIDYPIFGSIPRTDFSCKEVRHPGYYADIDAYCQVFHMCEPNGRQHSVLCPKGTIFNQDVLVCDWWYNVDCSSSIYYYGKNEYIYEGGQQHGDQSGEYSSRRINNNNNNNNNNNYEGVSRQYGSYEGVSRQYGPYKGKEETLEDYYDVEEPPYMENIYNRRIDTLDTTNEPTTITTTSIPISSTAFTTTTTTTTTKTNPKHTTTTQKPTTSITTKSKTVKGKKTKANGSMVTSHGQHRHQLKKVPKVTGKTGENQKKST